MNNYLNDSDHAQMQGFLTMFLPWVILIQETTVNKKLCDGFNSLTIKHLQNSIIILPITNTRAVQI